VILGGASRPSLKSRTRFQWNNLNSLELKSSRMPDQRRGRGNRRSKGILHVGVVGTIRREGVVAYCALPSYVIVEPKAIAIATLAPDDDAGAT